VYGFQTKLEEKIDKAISLQDFDTAEKLSDHLATREVTYYTDTCSY